MKLNRKYNKFKDLLGDKDPIGNLTIKQYKLSGELVSTHKSVRAAGKYLNIPHQTLYLNIIKKKKEEYGGFKWSVV